MDTSLFLTEACFPTSSLLWPQGLFDVFVKKDLMWCLCHGKNHIVIANRFCCRLACLLCCAYDALLVSLCESQGVLKTRLLLLTILVVHCLKAIDEARDVQREHESAERSCQISRAIQRFVIHHAAF